MGVSDQSPAPDSRPPADHGPQAPARLTANTGFLLAKVHEAARDRFERALAPLRLTVRQYGVLVALAEDGPLAQNLLGERLGIDRSSMVTVIDEAEAAGWVLRERNPRDRRAYQLQLTPDGRGALRRAGRVVEQVLDEVLAPLGRDERAQLHAMLTVLLGHLTR